MNNFEKIVVGE